MGIMGIPLHAAVIEGRARAHLRHEDRMAQPEGRFDLALVGRKPGRQRAEAAEGLRVCGQGHVGHGRASRAGARRTYAMGPAATDAQRPVLAGNEVQGRAASVRPGGAIWLRADSSLSSVLASSGLVATPQAPAARACVVR